MRRGGRGRPTIILDGVVSARAGACAVRAERESMARAARRWGIRPGSTRAADRWIPPPLDGGWAAAPGWVSRERSARAASLQSQGGPSFDCCYWKLLFSAIGSVRMACG